ncbi:MAG: rhomboid family intramembrane serine protease [Candidatus Latescibacterota bacterium]|nr:MAG: rhomboid family intramembrane serine protease [Candidatus Latescibacterota bacterium]
MSVFSRVAVRQRLRGGIVHGGRFGEGSFGFRLEVTPVVLKLLIANGAVWVLQYVFRTAGSTLLEDLFALNPDNVLPWRPWQLVTYMFLHGPGLWHIGFNMLVLWMFGGPVERRLGPQRFLRYYLICGIAGAVLQLLPPFRAPTVGASGAVLGVLTAFGIFYPNAPIYVLFIFPVPAKIIVIFLALVNLMSAAGASQDGIAYMAHLGGMAAGYVMLRGVPFSSRLRRRWEERQHDVEARRREEVRRKLDDILDKMQREGKESLSQEDWNTLLDESRRRRNS